MADDPRLDDAADERSDDGVRDEDVVEQDVGADRAEDDDTAASDDDGGETSDAEHTDALPEDLDVSGYVGPYVFPNNNRRRVPGYLYLGIAVICVVLWVIGRDDPTSVVNDGLLWAAAALVAAGAYCLISGFDLDVDEQDALVIATKQVGFPVGHASAQMGWRGIRSRPTWRILCYSAEDPPEQRALLLIDGVDGEVIDWFVEDNPEDWSDMDGALTGTGKPFPTGG
ncbi:hypothetical protein PO878_09480 [Iamia majanohamensis]|uniref:Uncharacterized protein n=1 Tax=Iamia majanohamensis TaxID=467976 RepID=A0AAE9YDB1_9ACTN|nr:hypothetical protein [Iamia majanohamensis]WCO68954.1 hypothetical protein PO878_09480 [Iamia majanohamensis]